LAANVHAAVIFGPLCRSVHSL